MGKYVLSPAAQTKLKNIRSYTLKNHGKSQITIYLKNLRDKIRNLAEDPDRGTARDEIKMGYYSTFIERHTIYYKILPDHIGNQVTRSRREVTEL
jgi:toxin ParE1/3/4